jgi:two-component system, sensor histidine kinase and response regulator
VSDRNPPRSDAGDTSRRVLIAEDNVINQRVTAAMLRHLGFKVDVVADGMDAVNAALATEYRVILMDCQIPGIDGYQATAEIRRLQESPRRTPIIAVTGSESMSDRQRCLAAGMDDYLAKPLRLQALGSVMARWAPQGSLANIAYDAAEPVQGGAMDLRRQTDRGRVVLDPRVVARLERLGATAGEDLLGQLAALFLADAEIRIRELRLALAVGDATAVVRSAHSLTGSSGNLGATELSRLCGVLAADGPAADLVGRSALVDGIEAELRRVRAALGGLVPAA